MRASRGSFGALLAIALGLCSCEDATSDQALDSGLRVSGAQFYRSEMPGDGAGPRVRTVVVSPRVPPGSIGKCAGDLEPTATAVALTLAGDPGYWILPAGLPDVTAPGFPTFSADVSFAPDLLAGPRNVVVRAVDVEGRFGPALIRPLTISAVPVPTGRFVISLSWNNSADLDLHVVDPAGVEIDKRNIDSYEPPPPGSPPEPPGTKRTGGVLDFDSNAACVQDGRRAENLVYQDKPPSGRYVVRVDASSLCGEINTRWQVQALLDGASIGAAEGLATEIDTRFPHDRGAGVLALELDVP